MGQHTPEGTECFPEPSQPETLPQGQSLASNDLTDLSVGAKELERARQLDLQADRSHVQELRALVSDFKLKGCSGPQEGYMAELLVQVRATRPDVGYRPSWQGTFGMDSVLRLRVLGLISLLKHLIGRYAGGILEIDLTPEFVLGLVPIVVLDVKPTIPIEKPRESQKPELNTMNMLQAHQATS